MKTYVEKFKYLALCNRETCRHWIDFEIFDFLPENLKMKYLNQFSEGPFNKMCNCQNYGHTIDQLEKIIQNEQADKKIIQEINNPSKPIKPKYQRISHGKLHPHKGFNV